MIKITGVTKSYNKETKAVDDLSLVIPEGKVFGFLGPNGAGKTTTIKMITGILPPDSGTIEINGIDIVSNSIEAKCQFGYVPDSPDMFLRLKGIEYLNFMANVYNVSQKERANRIQSMATKLDIADSLGAKLQTYSHGMRQKVVLIGSLIHNPKVWILDEPLTGLDPKSSYVLKEMMRQHCEEGGTLFFSTHVLDVAEKICDTVAFINHGKINFCGSLEELKLHFKGDSSLEKMFLEMTDDE